MMHALTDGTLEVTVTSRETQEHELDAALQAL